MSVVARPSQRQEPVAAVCLCVALVQRGRKDDKPKLDMVTSMSSMKDVRNMRYNADESARCLQRHGRAMWSDSSCAMGRFNGEIQVERIR